MENNVIIGTAGHIDHGKTTLIRALSGIETDTTMEEKERGMSINLGFAYFDLPSGKRCGVVDVPGHEKFIKNMLAGVSGINLVLLLIDSREGIMPQTKEHIDILTLLSIKNYIIVMTKIDLVEEEYRELVKDDIEEFIKGTVLENSPIVEVDSISKKGLDTLLEIIDKKTEDIEAKNIEKNARLNVDRSFQVKGFGTVVTGTLTEGVVAVGDELTIYPGEIKAKVRNIQVHSKDVEKAFAGQRTAINLANIKFDEISRGDTLATTGSLTKTYMLDSEITLIDDSRANLELWDRVRLYVGTVEVMARIVPLGQDELKQGDKGFAQLRLEEEVAVKNYDRFIIRTYSPMITIGGGVILDANPKKHRRFNEEILRKLKVQLEGNSKELVDNYLLTHIQYIIPKKEIIQDLQLPSNEIEEDLSSLLEDKIIYETKLGFIHSKKYEELLERLKIILNDYHKRNRLKAGIPKIELMSKFKLAQKEVLEIIKLFIKNNEVHYIGNLVSEKGFEVKLDNKQIAEKNRLEKELLNGGFTPPTIKDLTKGIKFSLEILESLVDNTIIRLDSDLVLHKDILEQAINMVEDHFKTNEKLTLAEFRDMSGSSRKYSMAILEYIDKLGITRRVENYRVLSKKIKKGEVLGK
ncbi:translation elongation factor [Gemella sp. oral taxon 928]|uniref:selenocysteine-specific translation elongation factor n=1 Tax=Gemella sp. oral taxon 928 TaxID=1785995 RepID=UPI0007684A73|nr:selenocysteine-specific translation elongation factor [Gemella sp. oral taxon 928]AME10032.1 translation elongation factor [Gemella sp. oral taxon 928]